MDTVRGRCPGGHSCSLGRGRAGRDGGRNTPPPWLPPHPPHTHAGSRLGAGRCRGSQAGGGHRRGRGCGAGSAGSARCAGRRRRGRGVDVVALAGPAGAPPGLLRWHGRPKEPAAQRLQRGPGRRCVRPSLPGPGGRRAGTAATPRPLPAPTLRAGDSSRGPSGPAEPGEGRLPLSLPVALAQASLGASSPVCQPPAPHLYSQAREADSPARAGHVAGRPGTEAGPAPLA